MTLCRFDKPPFMPDEIRQSPTDIPFYSKKDITLADVMREIENIKEDISEVKADIKGLRHTITGNGNPMTGIVVRTNLLERWRNGVDHRSLIHIVISAINSIATVAIVIYLLLQG